MVKKVVKDKGHYIVAIGASAGGLEAIHEFFDNMPESSNLSFVIIQHLSPDYKSLLVELVSRHTHMKVFEAEHNLPVRKNCVYVIPNNKFIAVKDDKLILTEKQNLKVPNNAIDVFMHSLAKEKKSEAIAVILSGTGTDGTKGVASVKEEGGLVIVQEPGSSKFDGMPKSVITSGNVDFVLPANEIPQQIMNFVADAEYSEDSIDDETLKLIFEEIHRQAGFDFHYYKTPTITRRVFNRMRKENFDNVKDYYNFLKGNPEECKLLGKDFLINVTRFFRDKEAFDVLKEKVFPEIIKQKELGEQIKLWICACSTGEEAYSLAIVLDEVIQQVNAQHLPVKIFATDIEKSNIEIASKGFYPKSIEEDVDAKRLATYFTKQDDGYVITQKIRKQIVFAGHNVIKDPPFIKNDLVSCRNMLIYMGPALQNRVYSVLLFSANKNGYIFLGTTENANSIKQHIAEVSVRWKIYKKVSEAKLSPYLPEVESRSQRSNAQVLVSAHERNSKRNTNLWDEFKETLFTEFNFAAFYIDRNFEIKEAVGNFDQILSLPKRILKLNLLRMLPGSVSSTLVGEIKNAWKTNQKKVIRNLHIRHGEKDIALQVMVKPESQSYNKQFTLIAFHFMLIEESLVTEPVKLVYPDAGQSDYVLSLEEELSETKNNLQHAIEDLETANEELQSSNEELLSANEELQSSNEELQSLNEELHTLNTEHQLKIKELIELNDDLNNYFRSSNIGQIFLDKNMFIRKFNPAAVRMINLIETDIGRPFSHISTNLKYSGLNSDIENVLKNSGTVEREVELHNGMNLLLRIMPYITQDQRTAGIIISFIDITTITSLNNIIRGVFNASLSAIFALESVRNSRRQIVDFSIVTANHAGAKWLKKEMDNIKGLQIKRDLKALFFENLFQQFCTIVEEGTQLHTDIFYEEEKLWFEVTAVQMADGLVATFSDITQKKNAEDRLKKNYVELVTTKDNLKKLNSELERKVTERTQMLYASEERFRLVARATNDAIWDWDLVNNKIWYSDAFYLKFGYSEADSFTHQEWLSKIHPEERKGVESSIHQTFNSGKKQWSKEYRFAKADGSYANILDRASVIQDEYGTPYRMLGSMLDLTDLKKAEQEIENIIEQRRFLAQSMPLIVWTSDAEGKVDFVNRQFETYTGVKLQHALNDGWKRVIHQDDLRRIEERWGDAITYKSDFQAEVRIRLFNGTYHWNILRAKVRKDEGGNVINWVTTTIDVHEQKQSHDVLEQKVTERTEELLKMNEALEVSNSDLQQFASVASHDLQEPLRKILLYTNLIKDRYTSELGSGANYLTKILHSSTRMKSIINNVLNYSKLSAENNKYEATDMNQLISEIIEDLEVAIQEKQAHIQVDDFPLIDVIPGQIRQVFQNMIGNALKFSKPDGIPEIKISAVRIDNKAFDGKPTAEGAYCRITISDNGIGFDKKFAENIFVLFQRLHSKDAYEGTGIGLAIVKKIVEKHSGIITASGEEGQGASFTIVLPIEQ
ncbi:chemotaxis protein CheB [Chryseosolibacter indicus]|uniref:PAS domain-containing protein n=1 Tax=Chryseosolibacter indicus TaxID=2782351 RepID=A0ABS5VN71_9BACT|nr:chemotaxis protein CheB [Chryseosolibacter indicus]MBT1702894.1 PAS domain-containing protein [Chryseosolibacter indicus]